MIAKNQRELDEVVSYLIADYGLDPKAEKQKILKTRIGPSEELHAAEKKLWRLLEKYGIKRDQNGLLKVNFLLSAAVRQDIEGLQEHELLFASAISEIAYARSSIERTLLNDEVDTIGAMTFICGANYSLGIIQGKSEEPIDLKDLFSSYGRRGALARHEPLKELREWAIQEYQKRFAGKKTSARNAAERLFPDVLKKRDEINAAIKENKITLTEKSGEDTLAKWIRDWKKENQPNQTMKDVE